jgi:hypothetical protein
MKTKVNFTAQKRQAKTRLWESCMQWLPEEDYSSLWLSEFRRQVGAIVEGKQYRPNALRDLVKIGEAERGRPADCDDWSDPLNLYRIKAALDLQVSAVHSQRHWIEALVRDIVEMWPCWEVCGKNNEAPLCQRRGEWVAAGGSLYEGRMIAVKWDTVWQAFSFTGLPHPPFNLEDDLIVEEVDVDEVKRLGVQ